MYDEQGYPYDLGNLRIYVGCTLRQSTTAPRKMTNDFPLRYPIHIISYPIELTMFHGEITMSHKWSLNWPGAIARAVSAAVSEGRLDGDGLVNFTKQTTLCLLVICVNYLKILDMSKYDTIGTGWTSM